MVEEEIHHSSRNSFGAGGFAAPPSGPTMNGTDNKGGGGGAGGAGGPALQYSWKWWIWYSNKI